MTFWRIVIAVLVADLISAAVSLVLALAWTLILALHARRRTR